MPPRRLALACGLILAGFFCYEGLRPKARAPRWAGSGEPVMPPSAPMAADGRYTNEQLQAGLQRETQRLGIQTIVGPGEPPPQEPVAGEGYTASRRRQNELFRRQLVSLRHRMSAEPESIPIKGKTAALLSADAGASSGGPLEPAGLGQTWSGSYGGGDNENSRTVLDAQAWRSLWRGLSRAAAPAVDFSRHEVVCVFLGRRPTGGYRVAIAEVAATESFVIVRYRETPPAPGKSPPEGETFPYVARVILRSDLPVRYEAVK